MPSYYTYHTLLEEIPSVVIAFLIPDADISAGSWTTELGSGSNLYQSIDETIASDADYIRSSLDPTSDTTEIRLSDPAAGVAQPMIVSYRYRKSGTTKINLTVQLMQGASQIASWSHSDITQSFLTANQTLSSGQFSSISDFTDLRLKFTADNT